MAPLQCLADMTTQEILIPLFFYCICIDNLASTVNNLAITEFPTNDGQTTLFFGETVRLNCSGLVTRRLTQYYWRRSNGTLVCPVLENPFCVPSNQTICGITRFGGCRIDTRYGPRCKGSRVHSYIYSTVENCTYGIQRRHAMMVINEVTWSDGGVYTCIPSTQQDKNRTMNVIVG